VCCYWALRAPTAYAHARREFIRFLIGTRYAVRHNLASLSRSCSGADSQGQATASRKIHVSTARPPILDRGYSASTKWNGRGNLAYSATNLTGRGDPRSGRAATISIPPAAANVKDRYSTTRMLPPCSGLVRAERARPEAPVPVHTQSQAIQRPKLDSAAGHAGCAHELFRAHADGGPSLLAVMVGPSRSRCAANRRLQFFQQHLIFRLSDRTGRRRSAVPGRWATARGCNAEPAVVESAAKACEDTEKI